MTVTCPEVDPRVVRWMSRRGHGLRLSAAAALLLAPRLRVRWWAAVVVALPVAVSYVVWLQRVAVPAVDRHAATPLDVLRLTAPYLVLPVALGVFVAITRWRDRRIAAELPRRVTRTGAVGIRTVLGAPACLTVAAVALIHVVILVLLAEKWNRAVAVSYGVGLVATGIAVAGCLVVVLRRPTVALDDSSLAIDERIRAQDAISAVAPWCWIGLGMVGRLPTGHAGPARTVILLAFLASLGGVLALRQPSAQARRQQ